MTEFEQQLMKFSDEARSLQKRQAEIEMEGKVFQDKLQGFLRAAGLPDNFTLPELCLLAARKSRL